jgi:hypothetical protein
MPALAPQATGSRRRASENRARSQMRLAATAPACLGGALAAERGPHADDDDGEDGAAQRARGRQPPRVKPDRRGNVDAGPARKARENERPDARRHADGEQHQNVPRRPRRAGRVEKRSGAGPHRVLHELEKLRENGGGQASREARQRYRQPKHDGPLLAQRRRNVLAVAGRIQGVRKTCRGEPLLMSWIERRSRLGVSRSRRGSRERSKDPFRLFPREPLFADAPSGRGNLSRLRRLIRIDEKT